MRIVRVTGWERTLAYQSYPWAYVVGSGGLAAAEDAYSGQAVVIWDPANELEAPGVVEFFEDVGNIWLLFMVLPDNDTIKGC